MTNGEHRNLDGYSTRDMRGQGERRDLHVENVQLNRPQSSSTHRAVFHNLTVEMAAPVRRTSPKPHSHQLISKAISKEYGYAALGLTLGVIAMLGGIVLSINGAAGSVSWTASFFGLKSELNDAAPGVALFVVGVFMVLITKPRVWLKNIKG